MSNNEIIRLIEESNIGSELKTRVIETVCLNNRLLDFVMSEDPDQGEKTIRQLMMLVNEDVKKLNSANIKRGLRIN